MAELNSTYIYGDLSVARTIKAGGNIFAYSTAITSDERLKDNIITIEVDSLSKLLKLRPVTFNWKLEGLKDQLSSGYIAQEFEEYFPELITEEDDYKHVRYVELIPHITRAISQQQEIIDDHQKQIDDLKEKVDLLMKKNN